METGENKLGRGLGAKGDGDGEGGRSVLLLDRDGSY